MMENVLQPTGDQVRAFRDRATGEPIYMLNLLKFRDKAEYEDGRESDLTGEQAYQLYGQTFQRVMGPKGARVVYSGEVRGALIGSGDDLWDAMMVIEYPSTQVNAADNGCLMTWKTEVEPVEFESFIVGQMHESLEQLAHLLSQ